MTRYKKPDLTPVKDPIITGPNLYLKITLGNMSEEDGFLCDLTNFSTDNTIASLIEYICDSDWSPSKNDLALNPDLEEMHIELISIFGDSIEGKSSLNFLSQGNEINTSDKIMTLAKTIPNYNADSDNKQALLLDIVLEQKFTPLDYSVKLGYWNSVQKFVYVLEEQSILFTLLNQAISIAKIKTLGKTVQSTIDRLNHQGLINELYQLTEKGRSSCKTLLQRSTKLDNQYIIFADVKFDPVAKIVEFNTGDGEDIRTQVYQEEGLDPVLTFFEVNLIEDISEWFMSWANSQNSKNFFNQLLNTSVIYKPLKSKSLEFIIEKGLANLDENRSHIEEINRAITTMRTSKKPHVI